MLVQLEHVSLQIDHTPILNDIHLQMEAGEIYGLLGPNGAGKSTTMSLLTGLRAASGGAIRVMDLDPISEGVKLHHAIGVLSEANGFYDWMNSLDYLSWFARLYGKCYSRADIQQRLLQVGLDPKNHAGIGQYSRGMKQRLGLARALLNDPKLLILDEPTNGLDPRGRREIHDTLLNLSQQHGVGILFCTHLLDDVDRLCTKIGIIHHGRTLLEGQISELLSGSAVSTNYRLRLLTTPPDTNLPTGVQIIGREGEWLHIQLPEQQHVDEVWRSLFNNGWRIEEIRSEGSGLESLYMNLTQQEEAA